MLLMSRHLTEYHVVPPGAVVRINLAWETSLEQLRWHLDQLSHHVFLDIPVGRTKPPACSYPLSDIIEMVELYETIRYVGVSNVTEPEDLMQYIKLPARVLVVPKIESVAGCGNIREIVKVLREPKTIMLDHDDLFHDMLTQGIAADRLYEDYVRPVGEFCGRNNVRLLRIAGVVFSDTY